MLATITPVNGSRFRLGLVVNPWAGIGGPTGLRGSDGEEVRLAALARGALLRAGARAAEFLRALAPEVVACLDLVTWGAGMGEALATGAGIPCRVLGRPGQEPTGAADTVAAARGLAAAGVDLLVFAGGDGTARDVCAAIGLRVPALGIPAGVKMYSGVFAVSPQAAATVVDRLVRGVPVTVREAEVRDIDEEAFRHDRVASRWFGELLVPGTGSLVQQVKCGRPAGEEGARQEIGAWVAESMSPGILYLVGTGSTPGAVMEALGQPVSLLGIDAVLDGQRIAGDLDAQALEAMLSRYPQARLVITATGGQGFLLGRGNQQLTASVLRRIGIDNLLLVATRAKLEALGGRPLLVDTGDLALDRELAGLRPVITGYDHQMLYRVVAAADVRGD